MASDANNHKIIIVHGKAITQKSKSKNSYRYKVQYLSGVEKKTKKK